MYSIFLKSLIISSFTFVFSVVNVNAQMFSIGSESAIERVLTPQNTLYFSLDFTEFSYYGPSGDNGPDFNYDFSAPLYRFQFENRLLNIYAAFGTGLGDAEDVNVTIIGLGLQGTYNVTRSDRFWLYVPVALLTDYTIARTETTRNTSDEFSQNSVYIGSGLAFNVRLATGIRFGAGGQPYIGYTAGSFGSTGGVSWKFNSDSSFYFDNLYRGIGLKVGYTFRFVRFENSNEFMNYDMLSHGINAGFTF